MKNLVLASFLFASATAFAQNGTVPTVNQADTKVGDAKTNGTEKMSKGKKALIDMKVNVNTASKEDLAKLPGIGPKKAEAIVANRPYTTVDGLTKVKGIGSATVNKIKDKITF